MNTFLAGYASFFLLEAAFEAVIDFIHAAHLKRHGKEMPTGFGGLVDREKLARIIHYSLESLRLNSMEGLIRKGAFLLILVSGLLPWIAGRIAGLPFVLGGLLFFAFPTLADAFVTLPFGYYRAFVIEEKYGFNTRTLKTWVEDLVKSGILSVILGTLLISSLLVMVRYAGSSWWLWAWAIFFSSQLLMLFFYPAVLAPIFNTFTPIALGPLAEKIGRLAKQEGLRLKGIYEMDAKKRSLHTNAYVSGLGKTRRVVLFDTLRESHDDEQILAILAHEIGHLKQGHLRKQLFLTSLTSFFLFYLASWLITWDVIYEGFGFTEKPFYAGLFLIGALWEPLGFFISPLGAAVSRRFEKQADLYAVRMLRTSGPFIQALRKMAMDNLSNLHPHRFYVYFHYSHPPLLERIDALKDAAKKEIP